MSYMFANDDYTYGHCLETLDLSSFDTRNVVDMTGMFKESDVKTIYVSEKWTTQNVKYSNRMFQDCWYICGGKELPIIIETKTLLTQKSTAARKIQAILYGKETFHT